MKTIGHTLEALERYFSGKNNPKPIANTVKTKEHIVKVGTRTYKVRRRPK